VRANICLSLFPHEQVAQFISILLAVKMKTTVLLMTLMVTFAAICHVADAQVSYGKRRQTDQSLKISFVLSQLAVLDLHPVPLAILRVNL
jgi:hypothetical protein